jgi:hypothetical protein
LDPQDSLIGPRMYKTCQEVFGTPEKLSSSKR